MRALLLLAAVLPSLAAAQGFTFARNRAFAWDYGGSQSFPITTTRASVACFSGDDEYVYSSPANTPRETGVKGVLSFEARTNSGTNSYDVSTWTNIGTPTVTTAVASGPFSRLAGGPEIGEVIDDDGAVSEGRQFANISGSPAIGDYVASCYLAAGQTGTVKTTARISYFVSGGTLSTTICSHTLTAGVARFSCPTTLSGTPTAFTASVVHGASAVDTGSLRVSECQLEKASFAGPPLPCGASACSTNADVHTTPTPSWLSRTEGCAKVCVRPENWSGPPNSGRHVLHGNAAGTARFGYINSAGTDYAAHNGTSTAGVAHSLTAGVESCFLTQWSATQNKIQVTNLATSTAGTAAAFTTFPAFDASLTVGSFPGNINHFNGWVRLAKLGAEWGACQ